MAQRGTGDGWVTVEDGTPRWGRFGAAGLLVRHVDADGVTRYFLARRSVHTHRGGTWAIPGGALDRDELPLEGALREFREEIGLPIEGFRVVQTHRDDHGGWSYWTITVDVDRQFAPPDALGWETAEARWVTTDEIAALELFDAFRSTLEHLGLI